MMIGRATPPEPAIAPSTQLSPPALNASAKTLTAAASPPDVHQCVTSRSTACDEAAPKVSTLKALASAVYRIDLFIIKFFSKSVRCQ